MAFLEAYQEGDIITGIPIKKIAGGLLVDVGGVGAFLPHSQVELTRPVDLDTYVGKEISAIILKIDETRRNVVISRRALLERDESGR